jgi:DNA polymerase I-like protein with 3'-5' exonuclease and polymerase domains
MEIRGRGIVTKFTQIASRYTVQAEAGNAPVGLRLVFDIEANGLLDTVSAIHCIVIADLDSDDVHQYGPHQIGAALEHLARADYLTGHNIVGYDLPLLRKLHQFAPKAGCKIVDTLVVSRLVLPHIASVSDAAGGMGGPKLGGLRGSHSLEAWGIRLGTPKAGTDITDFSKWTPELQARCVSDIAVSKALWRFLKPDSYDQRAIELEHRAALVCDRISSSGVPFDTAAAAQLAERWSARQAELSAALLKQFPGLKKVTRGNITTLLLSRGWVPEVFTETGEPSLNKDVLESVAATYPEFASAAEYFILGWLLGNMARGKSAWAKCVEGDGRIHAGLLHIGQPHGRASCTTPNLHGIPNPKKGAKFGAECRTLFRAPDGWVMVAADMANFQDRAFAHYLSEFDGGEYSRRYQSGEDMHWSTASNVGFVDAGTARNKDNKVHESLREGSKRFRYAFLFGAQSERLGRIIHDTARIVHDKDPEIMGRFFNTASPNKAVIKNVGLETLNRFVAATPGLRELRKSITSQAGRKWTPGLDGRRVPLVAQHTALNYLLVSAEAVVCKRWLTEVHDEIVTRFGDDAFITLWVHDEIVVCCRSGIADQVGEILVRNAVQAGEFYDLNVPLAADYRVNKAWAGDVITPCAPQNDVAVDDEHDEAPRNSSINSVETPEPKKDKAVQEDDIIIDMTSNSELLDVINAMRGTPKAPRDDGVVVELRRRLLGAGFAPLPIAGKRPAIIGWQKQTKTTVEDIERWRRHYPAATNTGVLTAHTPALDIDILQPAAAEAAETLARERFGGGGRIIVRYGRQPKRCIPFRCNATFPKIVSNLVPPGGGDTEKIELLADGQQFVVAGIHPDTKQPYSWHGGEIGAVQLDELPAITESEAKALVHDTAALLIGKYGYTVKEAKTKGNGAGATAADWASFIANPIDHDTLASFAMSLVKSGASDGAVVNLLHALVDGADGDAERKRRRHDEIPGMVSSARSKHDEQAKPQRPANAATVSQDLRNMTFKPIKYVVPGVIVEGLTLFAGKPKIGKSWLLLHAAIAVAAGESTLGDIACEEGDVLYCALEDNLRRLQSRMRILRPDRPWPARLHFQTEMPRLSVGGLDYIREWLDSAECPRLIGIDTLAMVRPPKGRDTTQYDADYNAVVALRALAGERGVAVVVVHHLRKMDSDDAFDTVSGTLGLTGAPDTILVLKRDQNGAVILHGRGRDLEELEKAMAFDKATCTWSIAGEVQEVRQSTARQKILNVLAEIGEPASPGEIAAAAHTTATNAKTLLRKLVDAGLVNKVERAKYVLAI